MPAPIRKVYGMAGKSPVTASDELRAGLLALADSRDRGEADRARAVLLTLAGWTAPRSRRRLACAKIRFACGAATSPPAVSQR